MGFFYSPGWPGLIRKIFKRIVCNVAVNPPTTNPGALSSAEIYPAFLRYPIPIIAPAANTVIMISARNSMKFLWLYLGSHQGRMTYTSCRSVIRAKSNDFSMDLSAAANSFSIDAHRWITIQPLLQLSTSAGVNPSRVEWRLVPIIPEKIVVGSNCFPSFMR